MEDKEIRSQIDDLRESYCALIAGARSLENEGRSEAAGLTRRQAGRYLDEIIELQASAS